MHTYSIMKKTSSRNLRSLSSGELSFVVGGSTTGGTTTITGGTTLPAADPTMMSLYSVYDSGGTTIGAKVPPPPAPIRG